jgi:hypothetical protein
MTDQSGSGGAWHPDPLNRYSQRWWDGSAWTDQVVDATGQTITDPMGVTAAPAVDATIVDPVAEVGTTSVFGAPPAPAGFSPGPVAAGAGAGYAASPTGYYAAPAVAAKPTNGLAIAALILGVGSLFFFWVPFVGLVCLPFALAGIVCGFMALSTAKQTGSGKGMAMAGVICGAIAIIGAILITVAVAVWVDNSDINSDPYNGVCNEERFVQDPDC